MKPRILRQRSASFKYALYGALFGLCFPIVSTILQLTVQEGLALTWNNIVWVQSTNRLLWVINSAPLVIGLFAYMGGRKQDRVNELNNDLERRVKLRTNELAKSNKELEETNSELKDFAYIVSHDLKAPLRAIGSLTDWIYEDNVDNLTEDSKEQMELLKGRVNRMNNLIMGILDYSRMGRKLEETQDVNLDNMLPEVLDMIAPAENFKIVVQENMPIVHFEKTKIFQVFQNLIGNAIKYNDKAEGHVEISWKDTGDFYQFSIIDNGPGIEERYFDKIFKVFQTLRPRDEVESTGIGLSIVKKVIDKYGGSIWVESEIDKGTTFHFTIVKDNSGKIKQLRNETKQVHIAN